MNAPAHLDGCSVVIPRQDRWVIRALEHGYPSFDGEMLSLVGHEPTRRFAEAERESLMPVAANCHLRDCLGDDFFVVVDA